MDQTWEINARTFSAIDEKSAADALDKLVDEMLTAVRNPSVILVSVQYYEGEYVAFGMTE